MTNAIAAPSANSTSSAPVESAATVAANTQQPIFSPAPVESAATVAAGASFCVCA